jgi:hypothetical protein
MSKKLIITGITKCTDTCPYFDVDRAESKDEKDEWLCRHIEAFKEKFEHSENREQVVPEWCPLPDE